jgi:hypothetical protein
MACSSLKLRLADESLHKDRSTPHFVEHGESKQDEA